MNKEAERLAERDKLRLAVLDKKAKAAAKAEAASKPKSEPKPAATPKHSAKPIK